MSESIEVRVRLFTRNGYVLSCRAMLQCSREACCIPFGENMAIQIFSFSFRSLALIDAVILAGIPSRQIR